MPLVRALKAKGAALKATEQPVRTGHWPFSRWSNPAGAEFTAP
jgi:hypothetical protein